MADDALPLQSLASQFFLALLSKLSSAFGCYLEGDGGGQFAPSSFAVLWRLGSFGIFHVL